MQPSTAAFRKLLAVIPVVIFLAACQKTISDNPGQDEGLAASSSQSQGASVSHSVTNIDVIGTPGPLPVPCANNGLGENIITTKGTVQVLSVVAVNGNNFHSVFKFTAKGIEAVGEITGDIYRGTGRNEWVVDGSFVDGKSTTVHTNVYNVVGLFGAVSFKVIQVTHTTIYQDGTTVTTVDKTDITCG